MDTNEIVMQILGASLDPLKSGEISAKTGIEKTEVDKVLKKLVKEEIVFSPMRCFYALKR